MRGEEPPESADSLVSEVRRLREVYEAILDALRAADQRFAAVEQQIAPSTGLVIDGGGLVRPALEVGGRRQANGT